MSRVYGTKNNTSITFICEFCNKSFIGHRKKVRFCSNKCNTKNWVLKHNKEIRDYHNIYDRKWYQKHKNRLRKYYRKWSADKITLQRKQVFMKYGSHCKKCGFSDVRALQIDHVNGGGNKEFRDKHQVGMSRGRRKFYKAVLEDTTGKYQILCANCNWIKRFEKNELNCLKTYK